MAPFRFRCREEGRVAFQELRRRIVGTRRCNGCNVSRDLFFGHRVAFNRQIWRGTAAKKQDCYETECKTTINERLAHSPEFFKRTSLSFDLRGFCCPSKARRRRSRVMAGEFFAEDSVRNLKDRSLEFAELR